MKKITDNNNAMLKKNDTQRIISTRDEMCHSDTEFLYFDRVHEMQRKKNTKKTS